MIYESSVTNEFIDLQKVSKKVSDETISLNSLWYSADKQ